MKNIKQLIREIIQETYPSRKAMHVTPLDYRSGGGRGGGVPAASKFTGDTPQRTALGRPPRPTPMHGQYGDPSVAGVDYMGSKMIQNSGDSYYHMPDFEDPQQPVPNLGDEKVRDEMDLKLLRNMLLLDPSEPGDVPNEDVDEISAGGVAGATVPLGAGPNYPNPSNRGKQPPSWQYYLKALGPGAKVVDPEF
jgi:hypothetical protein